MTRRSPEKKHPPKKSDTIPGVEYYAEGKGFTEQSRYRITNLSAPEGYAAYQKLSFRPGENEFERSISSVEKIAKRTLEGAGLPSDPGCIYKIPGGEKAASGDWNIGNLTALVEARGYRNRDHLEWFASEILINIQSVRDYIAEGKTAEAAADGVRAGELVGLAKAKGYFAQSGKEGGSQEKVIRPVLEWLRRTVKQYPDSPYTFYWKSLPGDDAGDRPEQVKGAKLIRGGGVLEVTYSDGRTSSITRSSFRRYVAIAKNSLKK